MKPTVITAEQWLDAEDRGSREARLTRVRWIENLVPQQSYRVFPGGWMASALFDEATYCFVYGQFVASIALGFAYIERTLAGHLYAAGNDRARHAPVSELVEAAVANGWLTPADRDHIQHARTRRNPMMHFREPLAGDTIEYRAVQSQEGPYDLIEIDARHVLEVVYRLFARGAA